jgi:hypothetical protein
MLAPSPGSRPTGKLRTMNGDTLKELDHRVNDGIAVWLLWDPTSDSCIVSVVDGKSGEAFEVPVARGERALDVFQHPFAYAAHRRSERPQREPAAAPR